MVRKRLGPSYKWEWFLGCLWRPLKDAFTSPVYSLARIRFDDLRGFNPFSTSYQDRLASHQKDLKKLLAGNGQERYRKLQADGKQKIQKGQEELDAANKQLADAREKAGQAQTQLTEQSIN